MGQQLQTFGKPPESAPSHQMSAGGLSGPPDLDIPHRKLAKCCPLMPVFCPPYRLVRGDSTAVRQTVSASSVHTSCSCASQPRCYCASCLLPRFAFGYWYLLLLSVSCPLALRDPRLTRTFCRLLGDKESQESKQFGAHRFCLSFPSLAS